MSVKAVCACIFLSSWAFNVHDYGKCLPKVEDTLLPPSAASQLSTSLPQSLLTKALPVHCARCLTLSPLLTALQMYHQRKTTQISNHITPWTLLLPRPRPHQALRLHRHPIPPHLSSTARPPRTSSVPMLSHRPSTTGHPHPYRRRHR